MEDLEEAIYRAQQAVEITPEDHPDLAAMLNNRGEELASRFVSRKPDTIFGRGPSQNRLRPT
jgi:hypothetical protein